MKKLFRITAALFAAAALTAASGCVSIRFEDPEKTGASSPTETVPEQPVSVPTEVVSSFPEETVSFAGPPTDPAYTQPPAEQTALPDPGFPQELPEETAADPLGMTPEQQLACFNDAVNLIKSSRVGFTKTKRTETGNINLSDPVANSLIGMVKSTLLPQETETQTVEPGESSDHIMSPMNMPFVSGLEMSDITDIFVVPSGTDRIITVRVKPETDPDPKGSSSAKIFDFVTADDVENVYAPKVGAVVAPGDISIRLENCTAKATLDASGRVTAYETRVECRAEMKNVKLRLVTTDASAVIVTTVDYSAMTYSAGPEF